MLRNRKIYTCQYLDCQCIYFIHQNEYYANTWIHNYKIITGKICECQKRNRYKAYQNVFYKHMSLKLQNKSIPGRHELICVTISVRYKALLAGY